MIEGRETSGSPLPDLPKDLFINNLCMFRQGTELRR
jgi:hypothetical protein